MVMRLDWFDLPLFLSTQTDPHACIFSALLRVLDEQATPHRLLDLLGFEVQSTLYGTLGGMKLALESSTSFYYYVPLSGLGGTLLVLVNCERHPLKNSNNAEPAIRRTRGPTSKASLNGYSQL